MIDRMRLSRRRLLGGGLVIGAVWTLARPIAASAAAEEPAALVDTFYATLLDAMKRGPELGFEGRYQLIEPVLNQTFDVATMCRIAVGPDWTAMSGEKKGELLLTFHRYIVTTYAARFRSFVGQRFAVGELKEAGEGRMLLATQLIRSNGEMVELNYLFRNHDGAWRVIDIYLAGAISQMAQMRAEFAQSLRAGGADALMASLEQKILDLKKEA